MNSAVLQHSKIIDLAKKLTSSITVSKFKNKKNEATLFEDTSTKTG